MVLRPPRKAQAPADHTLRLTPAETLVSSRPVAPSDFRAAVDATGLSKAAVGRILGDFKRQYACDLYAGKRTARQWMLDVLRGHAIQRVG